MRTNLDNNKDISAGQNMDAQGTCRYKLWPNYFKRT